MNVGVMKVNSTKPAFPGIQHSFLCLLRCSFSMLYLSPSGSKKWQSPPTVKSCVLHHDKPVLFLGHHGATCIPNTNSLHHSTGVELWYQFTISVYRLKLRYILLTGRPFWFYFVWMLIMICYSTYMDSPIFIVKNIKVFA